MNNWFMSWLRVGVIALIIIGMFRDIKKPSKEIVTKRKILDEVNPSAGVFFFAKMRYKGKRNAV